MIPDPNGVLDLPEGFSYQILEESGQTMSDGYRIPGRPDGMACFQGPDNTLILMRNHENSTSMPDGPYQEGQEIAPEAYDPTGTGSATRLVLDAGTFERVSSNLVLVGSYDNCAGGPSPWGWLSCEENTTISEDARHGYVFLCSTDAESVQDPQPIPAYGRFNHEAVAIDPSNNYAYLTEDQGDGCLYRFVPDAMDDPFTGTLQALKIVGQDNYNTLVMQPGEVLDVEWVDIDEPDPDEDTVRDEGAAKGAARIIRGEGIWFFEGQVYVVSTIGGMLGKGQIFRLIDGDSPTLELVVASDDASVLNNPDNITVAPWGELFVAEDVVGGAPAQSIRWITQDGEVCEFARSVGSSSELAGVCFSPSGDALFFNIQIDGTTVVVTGPFPGTDPGGDGDGDGGDGDGDPATGGSEEGTDGTDTDTAGETGTGGDPGLMEDGDGACSCSTEDSSPGLGVALTVAAGLGLRALTRGSSVAERDSCD